MANCSPGSNNNNIQVIQPPGQELSLSHGAAPTTGTTTSNQTEIESLASQTPAPAKSVTARGLPMDAHRVLGHTVTHGRPMGSSFHKWVQAGQHFSQFQPGPARPLRLRAASGWPEPAQ
ncbi:hypothetical protein PCANC_12400 [Puccinia coronata f. sp. avenae]|uniref:Uncharacterized protein n=1 Tax=Puccinia coronata f. sp. avenae TaxID=200324 RepID=A0A2N5VB91_9BASI|nr:hypothetical protein PCANC_12400 [Puccinia coronata f. sp. avenae]